ASLAAFVVRRSRGAASEPVEHAPEPCAFGKVVELVRCLRGARFVALRETQPRELDPQEHQLQQTKHSLALDQAARRGLVPRVVAAQARQAATEARDELLADTASLGLPERFARALRVVGTRRPHVRGEKERATLRFAGAVVL